MSLLIVEEKLERTIFHALLSKAVAEGYTPDITQFDVENADIDIAKAALDAYNAELIAIKNSKGFAIELFGYSNNQNRGNKRVPRIVVETQGFIPGKLGLDTTPHYIKQGDKYISEVAPSMLSDFYFSIHLVSNTVQQTRVLHAIMVSCLPRRGYIKWYDDDNIKPFGNIFVQYESLQDYTWQAEGIIEKVYRYEIPDAQDVANEQINDNISPICSIELIINNNNKLVVGNCGCMISVEDNNTRLTQPIINSNGLIKTCKITI